MTNIEGRVTLREATYPLKHQRKHDWQIICDLAAVLGKGGSFSFSSAEDIFEELRTATKGAKADYSGMTYDRLRKTQGILWPCLLTLEDRGTERLFEHEFSHPDKLAKCRSRCTWTTGCKSRTSQSRTSTLFNDRQGDGSLPNRGSNKKKHLSCCPAV